jgi:phosphoribosylformylglycinamidine synthase
MNQSYLAIPGAPAYSDFRLARLAEKLGATAVEANFVHYVDAAPDISEDDIARLRNLLGDHPDFQPGAANPELFYVVPRPGTISPWSSDASNIAQVCGLDRRIVKRIERGIIIAVSFPEPIDDSAIPYADVLHDRMTEAISRQPPDLRKLFTASARRPATTVKLSGQNPRAALEAANREFGLALSASEIQYLEDAFTRHLKRDPFDVELFMFAQVNSEHCRHKQFNASWTIDGLPKQMSLFDMIRYTHRQHPEHVISAYSDNAAVLQGVSANFWAPNNTTGEWTSQKEVVHYLAKVETHNSPTAVSPFPGAATGSGGEIRDEGAVGRGSKPKAGIAGYVVSDLLIPGFRQPWELDIGKPAHLASSFEIMIDAPLGSAQFNNEFGRPCTAGFFRTLTTEVTLPGPKKEYRGYTKPIMIAGGVGTVRPQHAVKESGMVKAGDALIVIGGPAMLIGLGGSTTSSMPSGHGTVELDFASVQRGNAEVQRRAQEVINTCTALGAANPILFIHDVGAGGLSNALPELVHDSGLGATFELREIDNADSGMSPMEIWCSEAQERYVLAVSQEQLDEFKKICKRERCGYSVVGTATGNRGSPNNRLILNDRESQDFPTVIDLPMETLFGKPPRLNRVVKSVPPILTPFDSSLSRYLPKTPTSDVISTVIDRVLALPAVGSKSFLITIGDRSVGGLTARDPMVGPWQVPLADVSVTITSLAQGVKTGEAMAVGEKPTLALISPAASARMAVAESLMNIAAASIPDRLEMIRLSANWMAASNHDGQGQALYEAVEAIGLSLCPDLGISIPVGKDSMSMKTKWANEKNEEKEVVSPLTVVITAFAPVDRVDRTWTPVLKRPEEVGETILLFVDLASAKKRMGGSALCQVFNQIGHEAPDVNDPLEIKDYFDAVEQLHDSGVVLAYHDRSDGGLFTTLVEMAFAGRCGLDIMLDNVCASGKTRDAIECLFNEELGAVFQVRKEHEMTFKSCFATCGPPPGLITKIGAVLPAVRQDVVFRVGSTVIYKNSRGALQQRWAETSHRMQSHRDNPACAAAEFGAILDDADPGLSYKLTYSPKDSVHSLSSALTSVFTSRPRVAILREEGVNGQAEMAFAFHAAGFAAVDVHMTDVRSGRVSLAAFAGLAACGGFSFGDTLGAGNGWAKSLLGDEPTVREFRDFFARKETFAIGVCNGCQFLSLIRDVIPGAEAWPAFEPNDSQQYEARVAMVEVLDPPATAPSSTGRSPLPPSVFLHEMHGSVLPVTTAHGEGRAKFVGSSARELLDAGLVAVRFVDNRRAPTERYPFNPNGSEGGITGVRTPDGRVLAMMPHPERMVLKEAASWLPEEAAGWGDFGAWIRIFRSARRWVG